MNKTRTKRVFSSPRVVHKGRMSPQDSHRHHRDSQSSSGDRLKKINFFFCNDWNRRCGTTIAKMKNIISTYDPSFLLVRKHAFIICANVFYLFTQTCSSHFGQMWSHFSCFTKTCITLQYSHFGIKTAYICPYVIFHAENNGAIHFFLARHVFSELKVKVRKIV
jgi:hypothetical protein